MSASLAQATSAGLSVAAALDLNSGHRRPLHNDGEHHRDRGDRHHRRCHKHQRHDRRERHEACRERQDGKAQGHQPVRQGRPPAGHLGEDEQRGVEGDECDQVESEAVYGLHLLRAQELRGGNVRERARVELLCDDRQVADDKQDE